MLQIIWQDICCQDFLGKWHARLCQFFWKKLIWSIYIYTYIYLLLWLDMCTTLTFTRPNDVVEGRKWKVRVCKSVCIAFRFPVCLTVVFFYMVKFLCNPLKKQCLSKNKVHQSIQSNTINTTLSQATCESLVRTCEWGKVLKKCIFWFWW